MHEKLMKIDYCNLRFCVFGIMCLITLFYAAVSVKNGFLGDSIRMVMIIHLISLVFLTLSLWYFLFKRKSIESMGYFTLFLFNVFLAVFFFGSYRQRTWDAKSRPPDGHALQY